MVHWLLKCQQAGFDRSVDRRIGGHWNRCRRIAATSTRPSASGYKISTPSKQPPLAVRSRPCVSARHHDKKISKCSTVPQYVSYQAEIETLTAPISDIRCARTE
ncbi:hypothetical protein M404DRAFT_833722 [Pisolithus tinctorius Marx 270]|uniref:Uncharacterized protein n=1 Tax=Pisolithus tinctorius Marx 270 TaxID=870435 RepID=A0A0C3JPJ7_PISTI|nr:hypothetical protein M404DRAFT_833722 [Pisolithus tinctorius Marx 270]